jgi:hypothetical protein
MEIDSTKISGEARAEIQVRKSRNNLKGAEEGRKLERADGLLSELTSPMP